MIPKTTYDSFIKIKAAHFRAAWRPVAESNRSKRFCRPLTKSLIQPAVAFGNACFQKRLSKPFFSRITLSRLKAGAKVLLFFDIRKYLCIFLMKKRQISEFAAR